MKPQINADRHGLTIANILSKFHTKAFKIDIETLLSHSISPNYTKLDLIKNAHRAIKPQALRRFNRYLKLYRQGCPIAYIVGCQEFMSLDFITGPGVLIPRPETEFVVEAALGLLSFLRKQESRGINSSENLNNLKLDSRFHGNDGGKQRIITDIGTGSGNIAVSIAKHSNKPGIKIYASDISRRALAIAGRNARKHKVSGFITFCQGSLFKAFKKYHLEGKVDVIVSNPPYVSPAEYARLPVSVRRYEPRQALYAPDRGLSFYNQIIAHSPAYLKPGGYLILEMGYKRSGLIQKLVAKSGYFDNIRTIKDYNGIERVIITKYVGHSI